MPLTAIINFQVVFVQVRFGLLTEAAAHDGEVEITGFGQAAQKAISIHGGEVAVILRF